MDNSQEIAKSETTAEKAQRSIEKTFRKINLIDYLPQDAPEKTVAILGAGTAIEVGPITRYFLSNGLNKPKVICFDDGPFFKKSTEKHLESQDVNFEYRTIDITDPFSFRGEQYDMVIIRKPESNSQNWKKAFQNGFDHLKPEGVFLATTDTYADFVLDQLRKGGEVVKGYLVPDEDRVMSYFDEPDLFVTKKIKK